MIFNNISLRDGKKMKNYLLLEMTIALFLFLNIDLMAQTLTVDPSLQIVEDQSGQTKFIVTSDINWNVSDDSDWLTVSPASGFGNDTLIATFDRNFSRSTRDGTIEISGGGITRTVTVTQAERNFNTELTLEPPDRTVKDAAGSTTFAVTSNVTWMVEDDAEWLTIIPQFGLNDDTLTATYSENTSTSQRTGTITITGGGITRTVTVTQAAGPAILTVTPSNQPVTNKAGSTTFAVESNTNWTVSDNAGWLTVNPASGNNNGTLTADYSENTSTSQRTGTITVTDGGITRNVTVTQEAAPITLTVTPSNQSVSNGSGNTTFSVESNTNWTVSDNAGWLTVSPASGNNNGTLTATFSENTTTSQRTGTITVTGGGITRTVTVTQAGTSAILTVTPSNQSVTIEAGSTTFTVVSNTDWTVSDNAAWLTVNPANGNNNGTLTADYSENTTTSQRTGTITIIGGGITRTVTVTQAAGSAILTVTPSNQSVSNDSGSTTFSVESNINWIVSDNAEWLAVNPASGNNNGTLTATYSENTTTSQRTGTITVTGGGITRTVTVTQAAGSAILTVTPLNRSVTYESGSTTFTVESNINWTVSDNTEWLTVSPASGNNNGILTAKYDENTTTSQRTGTITVTGGGETKTVTVTQAAGPALLTVTPLNRSVTKDSGSTTFSVESNTSWTVSDNANWLIVNPDSGDNNGTLTATYSENTTASQRTGTIFVTGGGKTKTVSVTQAEGSAILTVTPSNRSVTYESGSTTFTVESNTSWTVSYDTDWLLSVYPQSGNNNGTLTVTYSENTTTSQRTGTITVTGGGSPKTVTVTQEAALTILTVTPSNRSATKDSGSTTFTVESNTNWTVSDNAAWLTVSPASGNNNGTLTATYSENTTTSQRTGTITVTGGGKTSKVNVTQAARPIILAVTPSNQFVTYGSGSKTFTVESNTNWTVSDNAAWLTVDPTSGDSNGTLIATYSENTTASQRIGTITVTGGGISRTVTVTQSVSTITLIYDYKFADPQSTSNYQMIGLPGANNLLVSSVMTGSPGKDGDWRAFWDSGDLPLTEYSGNNEFYFKPGIAFWMISRYSIEINLSVSPVQLAADNTFSIQLHPGWNLISNPFNKVLSWNSVNSVNGGNLQPIYSFESGNYVNTSSFEPYKGYYFFNNDSSTSLEIPYNPENASPKKNSTVSKELKIILALNGAPESEISVGIAEDAKSGVDKLDIFAPPSLFCDVNMSLFSDEIETEYKYLQKEFRPGIGEGQDYNIVIKNTSDKTLKLATEGLENFSGYEVYLLDKSLVKLYDLRKQSNIKVPNNTSGKEYALFIGTEEYISEKKNNLVPFEYALYQNFPNPFNAETQIMFSMPRQGKVSLVIYNILGEVVAEVINDQFYEAGYHHVNVDFGNFSSGIYLYKLQTEFSGSQSFTETKKMILLK